MEIHSLSDENHQHLQAIVDKSPLKAQLFLQNKPVDSLTDEDAESLKDETSLSFTLYSLGVRLGTVYCHKDGEGEEATIRWDVQFETAVFDRFAAASRHRDWKHGIIGKSMRAAWAAADTLDLAGRAPSLADLLQPQSFTATRYDASRDKPKDRFKDVPLVNVNASGGGSTPLRVSMTKARAKAK
jgi:hypothetical protein